MLVAEEGPQLISYCKSAYACMAVQESDQPFLITPRFCNRLMVARLIRCFIHCKGFLGIVCNLKENKRGLLPNARGGNIEYFPA